MQLWSLRGSSLALALLALVSSPARAQGLPTGFQYNPVVTSGLSLACAMAFAPDGTLFVCERITGNVRVIRGGSLQAQPWCNVGYSTAPIGESGLLGIAVDPQYLTNGFVYLFYTDPNGSENRIARVRDVGGFGTQLTVLSPNGAMPTSATRTHNGGRMTFGNDGKLYVCVGDGDVGGRAQNPALWQGKILRLEAPNLTVPVDNPIPGSPAYALGVRNSFGIASHQDTGWLFTSENGTMVGDEINRPTAGSNLGWPTYEGNTAPVSSGFVNPLLTLTQQPVLTGLAVYSGDNYPGMRGDLFFCQWLDGTIRRLTLSANGNQILSNNLFADHGTSFDLQMGPDGNLWVLHGASLNGGNEIGRYVYTSTSLPDLHTMAISGPSLGGALTLGMTASNGDFLIPWLGLTLFQPAVPTIFGLLGTPADALLPMQLVVSDNRAYFGVPLANTPQFFGVPLYAQALRINPTATSFTVSSTVTHILR